MVTWSAEGEQLTTLSSRFSNHSTFVVPYLHLTCFAQAEILKIVSMHSDQRYSEASVNVYKFGIHMCVFR